MASRVPSAVRALSIRATPIRPTTLLPQKAFHTSQYRLQSTIAPRRPVGAFRGTLFGFLLGTALSGAGLYYYVIDEYKVSNELLTEDIHTMQSAVQRLEGYVRSLEEEVKGGKQ